MKYNPLVIGNLKAKYPLIQGGMGVGISLSNLAGNVAKEGGIGIISAAHPGYLEDDFENNTFNANIRALKNHIKKAKEISSGGIIGVNVMVAMKNYQEFIEASIEGGADLIISGAGLPTKLPEYVKGSSVKIIPIVSSAKAASVLLKYWKNHYKVTADALIIEGPKAGGHLGFKAENLEDEIENFSKHIIKIIEVVKEYEDYFNKEIPVIIAGGIYTADDVKYYLNLGAKGVQCATKFVPTFECDAHLNFKMQYLNAFKEDIKLVTSPVGMPGRAINNSFIKNLKLYEPIKKCYNCLTPCNPVHTPYCISDALIQAAKGNIDNGLIFCGSNAYRTDKLLYVKEVINELFPS